ncbi:hypothetical protein [Sporisorium scitamineum]|uniref:Uncharacterized protein n=1 Tax=Sporisorium scitamineum TaxID=49012 RepID=A0A0F7S3P5_9BASI|nr:hypothetical protein [Sporisorium scitamineum]
MYQRAYGRPGGGAGGSYAHPPLHQSNGAPMMGMQPNAADGWDQPLPPPGMRAGPTPTAAGGSRAYPGAGGGGGGRHPFPQQPGQGGGRFPHPPAQRLPPQQQHPYPSPQQQQQRNVLPHRPPNGAGGGGGGNPYSL